MKARDYDSLERQARREFESAMRLLRAAYDAKLNAIKVLRLLGTGPSSAIAKPEGARLGGDARPVGKLQAAFDTVFLVLPDDFTKDDVMGALQRHAPEAASETDPRAISAFLGRLASSDPRIAVKESGSGRAPTIYTKVSAADFEEDEPF